MHPCFSFKPRITLCLAALVLSVGSATAAPINSIHAVPRLQSYPWMPLARWYQMHAEDVALAEAGEAKVLFIGDSITEGWAGRKEWKEIFEPMGAVNFGIGGDRTENLLWRLEHGAVSSLRPKALVLLIGTNNFGLGDADSSTVALGVRAVVHQLRTAFPDARLLLFGIFPRDENPDTPLRTRILEVNADIQTLHDGKSIFYEDIANRFLEADGHLTEEIMPDFLHLSDEGYRRWAEAILPYLEDWVATADED